MLSIVFKFFFIIFINLHSSDFFNEKYEQLKNIKNNFDKKYNHFWHVINILFYSTMDVKIANEELNKMWENLKVDNSKVKDVNFLNYSDLFQSHKNLFIKNIIKSFKEKIYNNIYKIGTSISLSIIGIFGIRYFYKKYYKKKINNIDKLILYNLKNSKLNLKLNSNLFMNNYYPYNFSFNSLNA